MVKLQKLKSTYLSQHFERRRTESRTRDLGTEVALVSIALEDGAASSKLSSLIS